MSMRQIAEEAGVSLMTVSLALRHSARISAATRERIHAIAKARGYVPNPRLGALMNEVRRSRVSGAQAVLGLVSLYPEAEPAERIPHLGLIARGAQARARELGYRLEKFWLRAPGMTPRRLRGVLEARGVSGLLCLGSLLLGEEFPRDFERFTLVTMGLSIATHLHRVANHHQHDAMLLHSRLAARGYRRPGLLIKPDWEVRTGYCFSATCLLFQERTEGRMTVPVIRSDEFDAAAINRWLDKFQPDVIILNQPVPFYAQLEALLRARRLKVPRDIGVAFSGSQLVKEFYAGVGQDHELIGRCGIDMLAGRIQQRDVGFPLKPKTEFVEGMWIEGESIRSASHRVAPVWMPG